MSQRRKLGTVAADRILGTPRCSRKQLCGVCHYPVYQNRHKQCVKEWLAEVEAEDRKSKEGPKT